jgi:glutamyl-tRNA synthetase
MVELFDLKSVNVSASTFNTEKLLWLNHQYIMNSDPEHVAKHLEWHMDNQGIDLANGPELVGVVKAQRERSKTLVEMASVSRYFYQEFDEYDAKAAKKNFKQGADEVLQYLMNEFSALAVWDGEKLHQIVLDTAENMELKLGKVAQPLRVAVSGAGVSPAIDVTLSLLGREKTLARMARAIAYIKELA